MRQSCSSMQLQVFGSTVANNLDIFLKSKPKALTLATKMAIMASDIIYFFIVSIKYPDWLNPLGITSEINKLGMGLDHFYISFGFQVSLIRFQNLQIIILVELGKFFGSGFDSTHPYNKGLSSTSGQLTCLSVKIQSVSFTAFWNWKIFSFATRAFIQWKLKILLISCIYSLYYVMTTKY